MSDDRQAGASGAALLDVNAETYPFETVQHLLDQAATFNLFAAPDPSGAANATLTPGDPNDYFGINGGYGIDIRCTLHAFDATALHRPTGRGIYVHQAVGPEAGRLRFHLLFGAPGMPWAPDDLPPPAIYDPWRSQLFAMKDCEMTFGDENGFHAYGIGRTFPITIDGRPRLLAGGVGNVMRGGGKFAGLEGTFVMTGTITPDLGFVGNVTLRVMDPEGTLRSDRELSPPLGLTDPDPCSSFVVLRGIKRDRTVKTLYGPPAPDGRVSLITPADMRSLQFGLDSQGSDAPRTSTSVGQVVATFDATVLFDLTAPPGTAERPVPFTTEEVYRFVDEDGQVAGTINAGVVEGVSFGVRFPAAPGQPGVRFAGFGPITGGTGFFENARGMLTVNSVIGIAPHTLSLVHVLHLVDGDVLRRAEEPRRHTVSVPVSSGHPAFEGHRQNAVEYLDTYLKWRRKFRRCSHYLAATVAKEYNRLIDVGDFPGRRMDPARLTEAFEKETFVFDPVAFNRYEGFAKGAFREYSHATRKEVRGWDLYSYWPPTIRLHDRFAKEITGSLKGFVKTDDVRDPRDSGADLILNSFHESVGVTSWVEIYSPWRQQRTSFAYKLPDPHEILWFVKDVSMHGRPVDDDIFMASHEWRGVMNGTVVYLMVGIFFNIDFHDCSARIVHDTFWRAMYVEEERR